MEFSIIDFFEPFPYCVFSWFKFLVPKVGDANKLSHKHLFQKLLRKNASEFSEEETAFFLTYKESQYDARRERVETYCHTKTKDREFGKKIIKNSLIYDERDGVSYCQIAKVASSSWCNHFIKLGKFEILSGRK